MPRQSGRPKRSGFGANSTAEQVTDGIDLTGKTALITGVNSGLGFETMRVLAARGAHIIGAARTMEKAEEACAQIDGKTTPVACELSELSSAQQGAKDVAALDLPLDMLICNAGIMALPRLEQKRGLELQFLTNHLGHFVLVNNLLDQVTKAPAGRVVMLSSLGHRFAPLTGIPFYNLSGDSWYTPFGAYGISKLANILMAKELDKRFDGTNATANALHPGAINTNLSRNMGSLAEAGANMMAMFGDLARSVGAPTLFKNVEEGAATTCYVATSPDLEGYGGLYFSDCNAVTPSLQARDADLAKRLWQKSEELAADFLG